MSDNPLSQSDRVEFTKIIADDLEGGEVDKVTALFQYNASLFELAGELVKDERMKVRLGINMVIDSLKEEYAENTLRAVPGLIQSLKVDVPTFRGDAADLLGMIGTADHIKYLEPLLNDEHPQVAEIVSEAIECIRERSQRQSQKHDLYFLHGMESSPKGTKAQLLKGKYPQCQIPELPPDIHQRARILEKLITRPSFLIGSSLGGLSAVMFAADFPDLVTGLILLAPAVGFYDETIFNDEDKAIIKATTIPEGVPTFIIAGERDDVIPLEDIKALVDRSPGKESIEMIIVDDDHSLNGFPELLLDRVESLYNNSK